MFVKPMIIRRLKQLTTKELLDASKVYDFSITNDEAEQIIHYLQNHEIDPFKVSGRAEMLKELAIITSPKTAQKANTLFITMIRSYGVSHLFETN